MRASVWSGWWSCVIEDSAQPRHTLSARPVPCRGGNCGLLARVFSTRPAAPCRALTALPPLRPAPCRALPRPAAPCRALPRPAAPAAPCAPCRSPAAPCRADAPTRRRGARVAVSHLRRILLVALTLLVLASGMTPARTTAASEEAPEARTVATVLYPGWNLVGWLGSEALVTDLFDAIPTLQQVSDWDAEDGAYRHAVRHRYDELPTVKPGAGLWLRLRGDATVEWTCPAEPYGVLLAAVRGHQPGRGSRHGGCWPPRIRRDHDLALGRSATAVLAVRVRRGPAPSWRRHPDRSAERAELVADRVRPTTDLVLR